MRVELIDDTERFRALRQEWDELLEQSAADCLFLTWEWLYPWWTHCADGRKLCLLAVRDGGDLIGVAPLAVSPWRVTRFRLFHARSVERQHLHVDAGGIHLGDALVADILKLLVNPYAAAPSVAELFGEIFAWTREERRTDEMLFKGDGSH